MTTLIRPEISKSNTYYIPKHRFYELKHFCLQYSDWKKEYNDLLGLKSYEHSVIESKNFRSDNFSEKRLNLLEKIMLVEDVCRESAEDLYGYLLKAVTEEKSYQYLRSVMQIPCCKDIYYDCYRRFFWLLDKKK